MVIKTLTTNKRLFDLINRFRKKGRDENNEFYSLISKLLAKNKRNRSEVNLFKIEEKANEKETIVIAGKVLSNGRLTKKITIYAFDFSEEAKNKIKASGSQYKYIEDLLSDNIKEIKIIK